MTRRLFLNSQGRQAGFTIVELMIAMAIFSVVLLVMINSITNYFKTYNKSLISTSAQNLVQNISDKVEQAVEYGSATPPTLLNNPLAGQGGYCIGDKEFLFYLGQEQPTETQYALYELPASPLCSPIPEQKGVSLLSTHYRLINFSVTSLVNYPTEYSIIIKIAYTSGGAGGTGDDLLCDPHVSPDTNPGGCDPSANNLTSFTNSDLVCKDESASEFCAVAGLQSIVQNRLQ